MKKRQKNVANQTSVMNQSNAVNQNYAINQTDGSERGRAQNNPDDKQDDFIMLPIVDFCFKELMYNENIRRNIIAALLNIRPEEVEETTLLPTILRKQSADDKYGILDVRVKLKNGVQMDFEMQVIYLDYWENRSVYYLSKMCAEQLKEGQGYEELQKCIQVSILNHTFFEDDEECYRRIALCDTKTGREYTDRLEMHIFNEVTTGRGRRIGSTAMDALSGWKKQRGI